MTAALIVAHGQPSDPLPAAAELARLADRVAALLPDHDLAAATLAEPGALARATAGRAPGVVFPLFMAGGWFTRHLIPARLAEAGATGWQVLEPFGCDPAVQDLAVRIAAQSGAARVLLAAHGSSKSPAPSAIARHLAARITAATGAEAAAAFIDQTPRLALATGYGADAVCLPFFAMPGGHVTTDLPAALAEAGFGGRLLPAVGQHPEVPALIARAIVAAAPVCAGACRWA